MCTMSWLKYYRLISAGCNEIGYEDADNGKSSTHRSQHSISTSGASSIELAALATLGC